MERYHFTDQERKTLEGLQVPLAVYQFIDKRVTTLVLSEGFCELLGYSNREAACWVMDNDMYRDTHPEDRARVADAAFRFATQGGNYDVSYRSRLRGEDEYSVLHSNGRHVVMPDGTRLAFIWYMDEGLWTEETEAAADTEQQKEDFLKETHYDYLTGLPGMTYFFELAEAGRHVLQDEGEDPVLLYMDLNGMKYFNHKNGFTEGNKLLQAFADLLVNHFSNDSCCHISADHFAVFTVEKGLEARLDTLFGEARRLNGGNSLPVRVGVYPWRMGDVPVSTACDRAKFACDALRKTYNSGFNYYNEQMRNSIRSQQYIRANLDKAIAEKWIQVYYQPIVRAATDNVCAEEALARWIDPEEGFLSPADFIPVLEENGLIYKLDLYVLEQVLEKLQADRDDGINQVPHSINLSRSDFDACDMVEEICRRTDAAGIARDRINIEITESMIGSDFGYMKEQIERFRALGFPVWMDDFGSGYSSLDVLQSIRFDLIKFDMSFMQKLDEGENGRIILTELMKLAEAIGVDTLSEGVEKEEQVRFLQEIGCSRLQGFFFSRPLPLEQVQKWHREQTEARYEDPADSSYYNAIGRVNLFDLTAIASEEGDGFENFSNTIPMTVLEVGEDTFRYIRSNEAYKSFIQRFFRMDLPETETHFRRRPEGEGTSFADSLMQCREKKNRMFLDELMPDGSLVHSFLRKISTNKKTGKAAIAVAVLSVTPPDEGATYAGIARALAADYYNLYYVDLETDKFIEYTSRVGEEALAVERHGEDFFAACMQDCERRICAEDREFFLASFSREKIIRELDEQGVFTLTYRLIDTGSPMYVNMKITRMRPGRRYIIMGISVIDTQMKEQDRLESVQKQRDLLARIMSLTEGYLSLYSVDPVTGAYIQCSTTEQYEHLGFDPDGEDFFFRGREDGKRTVHPEDLPRYLEGFTKENVLRTVREKGVFTLNYRLVIRGEPVPVTLKIVLAPEKGGDHLIAGVRAWSERQ